MPLIRRGDRGLAINAIGGNYGIRLQQGARLRIENCSVSNFGTAGIAQEASDSEMIVADTVVQDNATGITAVGQVRVLLERVRVEHNAGDGIYLSGLGTAGPTATIRNSTSARNGFAGVTASLPASPGRTQVMIEDSTISQNSGDGVFVGGVSNGVVGVALRRNSIAANAFSGLSVFVGAGSGGLADVTVVDNSFVGNTNAHSTANGAVNVDHSRNAFSIVGTNTVFNTVNGAYQFVFGDNIGYNASTGSSPMSATPF
jgi:hypothetical protein